jgi:hypothetical protein
MFCLTVVVVCIYVSSTDVFFGGFSWCCIEVACVLLACRYMVVFILVVLCLVYGSFGGVPILCIAALPTTKEKVLRYVNIGQCRNTSRQIQVNVK